MESLCRGESGAGHDSTTAREQYANIAEPKTGEIILSHPKIAYGISSLWSIASVDFKQLPRFGRQP